MPPKKRGGENTEADTGADGTSQKTTTKRQRVSLACDTCRVVRERCDGAQPTCGTCISQNRTCTYSPTSKKRGLQTGYLRTIELSLAWLLFENSPETEDALCRLLANKAGVLQKKGKAADRLHKKWCRSRASKDISQLLSGESPSAQKPDGSDNDSDTDGDKEEASTAGYSVPSAHETTPGLSYSVRGEHTSHSTTLRLPSNWKRLLDIYFTYTHCWFPILNQSRILQAAYAYPSDGICKPSRNGTFQPEVMELWAVLALSAFQDASSKSPTMNPPPGEIFAAAKSLIPTNIQDLGPTHVRSILLHSLILIGQGANLPAWLLVGTATRIVLHLRATGDMPLSGERNSDTVSKDAVLCFAACLLLDTVTSACLGQIPLSRDQFGPALKTLDSLVDTGLEPSQGWEPVQGLGSPSRGNETGTVQPIRTFRQLVRFGYLLSESCKASSADAALGPTGPGPQDITESLDPEYAFCNSVIFGGSTPTMPSAFLLRTAFLATTTQLVHDHRPSLLSSLLEVVDSCMEAFGVGGVPPITVAFLAVIQRCGQVDKMHDTERTKWDTTTSALKKTWGYSQHANATAQDDEAQFSMKPRHDGPLSGSVAGTDTSYEMGPPTDSRQHPTSFDYPHDKASQFDIGTSEKPSDLSRVIPLVDVHSTLQQASGPMKGLSGDFGEGSGGLMDQHVDYDALLEELGSIDCAGDLDADPHFMTNLGFAPGCDLGEMFQGAPPW